MKKIFALLLCAAFVSGAIVLTGCKCRNARRASAAALRHAEHIEKGNYDQFADAVVFVAIPEVEVIGHREDVRTALKEDLHPVIQSKGGIRKTRVKDEKVAPDGQSATVTINHEYYNGQLEDVTYHLVRIDDDWKVNMAQRRDVWHIETAEGNPLTIKVKDSRHRHILKEHGHGGSRDFLKVEEYEHKDVLKLREDGEREVLKVKEHADGGVVVKEIVDGHREVMRIRPE
ncbi:MAG: DUF4878 domain-containing protein [Rikenellaceae bacterium]|nr:DUF4878 domain-containing protein [Rikenellaceae bacterium]MCL2692453.1 DUF4878 domain-containing protein [Rikenellaceae bacterium]